MAGPNQNNTFLITLSTGNLTSSNVIIKPLETRLGYPHGVRFSNTYIGPLPSPPNALEPTYPITISNVGISIVHPTYPSAPNINTSGIVAGTTVVNNSLITIPLLSLGGSVFSGDFGGIVSTQIFTNNGTWFKPDNLSGNEQVLLIMWGAGGDANGYYDTAIGTDFNMSQAHAVGGGGAACLITIQPLSNFGSTVPVTVGQSAGVSSVFGSITCFGGGNASNGVVGIGGGLLSGGAPLGGFISTFGGGAANGGSSIFGGAGGGYYDEIAFPDGGGTYVATVVNAGNSLWGGGGGGISGASGGGPALSGTSIMNSSGTLGQGGYVTMTGGSLNPYNITTHAGARGEVRVWVIR